LFAEVETLYDQADYCQELVARHARVRDLDMQEGTITWRCGDVKGLDRDERGLEYCEYMAVSEGQRVDQLSAANPDAPLYCLFTSVFSDALVSDDALATALAAPENFGAVTDPTLVRMQRVGFNARAAADGLIAACREFPPDAERQRLSACFLSALEAERSGDVNALEKIDAACRLPGLGDDEVFAEAEALGVRVLAEGEPGFQEQSEVASCLLSSSEDFFTIMNADNTICGRTARAGTECGCDWGAIPEALDGFLFTEWLTPKINALPPECRRAKVNGEDYNQLMLCEVPAEEIAALSQDERQANNLQGFCDTRFGQKLAVKAPIRAIEIAGSCRTDTEFCAAFSGVE
jgi:hypothetical protein